jgi:hypothetical protein
MTIYKWVALITMLASAAVFIGCSSDSDGGPAQKITSTSDVAMDSSGIPLHILWNDLLSKYVVDGHVDYAGFKKEEVVVQRYLDQLANTHAEQLTPNQRLAFWINAYNAFTVKLILNNYPGLKSIKDIPSRWKKEEWNTGGTLRSLNDIEHEILRKEFAEPRIHFAIVCASISCPDLAAFAFTADKIDEQLSAVSQTFFQDQTKGFKTAIEKGLTGGDKPVIYFSKILKWFSADFERGDKTVLQAIAPYLSDADKAFLAQHQDDLSINYFDYDWNLNGK